MKSVLIAMPSGSGTVPLIMVQSLLQLRKPLPCGFGTVERQRIDKARNIMALQALQGGFDYLFFVDDDNPIDPDTLELLLEDDKDIVSGVILSRNPTPEGVHNLCLFTAKEKTADGKPLKFYYPMTKLKGSGPLHKVAAVGTGCLLINRQVLEVLNKKYKDNIFEFGDIRFKKPIKEKGVLYDRRTMSEDCEFSERAADAGFELWADDRVTPKHLTVQGYVKYGNV